VRREHLGKALAWMGTLPGISWL